MKIAFFGTPKIVLPSILSLHRAPNIEITAIITQPDKKVGRKQTITPPPAKELANELDIPIYQPENKKELAEISKEIDADFFIVFAFGMVFPKKVLKKPNKACINIHASLLPKYRGASPIQEALLNGDEETGISIMQMSEGLDEGDVYLIRRFKLEEKDNQDSLTNTIANLSSEILPTVLQDIESGFLTPLSQNHSKASYCRKIEKEDGKIDWQNKTAKEIKNMVRAYNPWPSTFTNFHGKKLKIIKAKISPDKNPAGAFKMEGKILKIGTKKGSILPEEVQLEGKKTVNITDFINGNRKLLNQNMSTEEPAPDKEK